MFGVYKALYDYTPQDPETELPLVEGQVLYILVKEDEEWWKAKVKTDTPDEEGTIGLVPSNYLEESEPLSRARAIYAYEAANGEELTIGEDDLLLVYEKDDEWLLVKIDGGDQLGYVPANYVQEEEGSAGEAGFAQAEETTSPVASTYVDPSERVAAGRDKAKADAIQTWVVSEIDKKKKKKKGTLGVGNGAVFFASESDKNPIQQYPISTVTSVSQDGKLVYLTVSTVAESPIQFHCSSSSDADAIVTKLHSSKDAAGGASLSTPSAPAQVASEDEEEQHAPAAVKAVRWAPSPVEPTTPVGGADDEEEAVALYDFDADPKGEDELSVREGERLVVLDKNADEDWWRVRNSSGREGVVPAQYVEISTGGAGGATQIPDDDSDDEREAQAVAAANAEKEAAEIRAQAERVAEEKRERQRAEDKKRRREDERTRKEEEARRREEARRAAPPPEAPRIRHRPSEQDVNAARKIEVPKGRGLPDRPAASSSSGKARPSENRTRIWHDKSGQFKVEAEFLGFKGGKIRLHKLNGVVIEVPLEKMSPEDMDYIERVTGRKQHRTPPNDDDVPLAQTQAHKSRATSSVSRENAGRSSPAVVARPKKPRVDWFEFFLSAGCDMDDCTRYAQAFERDKIDEAILPDIESGTLRSIGLREGDIIRVKKAINARNPPKEKKQQIESDEAYARRLQEEENGGRGATSSPSPGLFTSSDGALKNNTRRGRPERKATDASSVDASAIASASSQLTRKETPPVAARSPSPPPVQKPTPVVPAPVANGFDDDAWTPRPSSTKPTTPAPAPAPAVVVAPAPTPPQLVSFNSSSSITRPTSANPPQASASFDYLSQLGLNRAPSAPIQQPLNTGMSNMSIGSNSSSGFASSPAPAAPQSYHNGLGFNNSQAPMGQLLQNQQTGAFQPQQQQQQPQQQGPRGPLAPVPGNQSLLSPLIPANTGAPHQFIPTRQQASPSNYLSAQPTGFSPQQTGYQQPQQQPQQTGYQQPQQSGFQQPQPTGFAGGGGFSQPQGFMPTQQTGLNSDYIQGQVNANASALSSADQFNSLASARPQASPQAQSPQNFNPSNVFASMKNNKGILDASAAPQSQDKYNALRPQVTGFPMQQQQPQQTGFMQPQQQQGFMQPQQTGFPMMGMPVQQQPQQFMQPQQTGFMPQQQTGYNPYGQQQQQQQQQTGYRGF